tara:strand:- start:1175 stop:1495 length:321 start_codon:yes stop_codon:yes gene_type:complete
MTMMKLNVLGTNELDDMFTPQYSVDEMPPQEAEGEAPFGALPEEVEDDIPVMLSEGEYVMPADVVRYWGIKFLEDLRAEAKSGLMFMQMDGRLHYADEEMPEESDD